jgi:hypothetical protein
MEVANKMSVSTKELPKAITEILYAGLVPYIRSSPGLGKSSIVKQVSNTLNLELIDVRLAQLDVSDMCGFPTIINGKTSFVPPDVFPIAKDPIPKGKDGWLLFLDELSSASNAVSAAAYKLILDRKVGQHPLHSNVAIAAAGNKDTDKAIVNRMSTAMQSRLVHLNVEIYHKDWIDWANENKIDHRIVSFVEFKPALVHSFNPDHKDNTFPCPRTWEFAHSLVKDKSTIDSLTTKILVGTIGEGAAREFKTFTEVYDSLPKISAIIANPTGVTINNSPDVLFAITGLIAYEVNKGNISQIMQFVNRLPLEFQIITWVSSIKRNKEIYSLPAIKEWISKNAKHVQF